MQIAWLDPVQNARYGQAGLVTFVLKELPNEKGNDAGRILCFGMSDDCFCGERSHESCADPR
jgi:hypothetical protein